jgi:hypothetical protein
VILLTLAVLLCLGQVTSAATTRQLFTGSEIPTRIYVGSHFIYYGSDTLMLNGTRLEANRDYHFDSRTRSFDLSPLKAGDHDTLLVTYAAVPVWLSETYGQTLVSPATIFRPGGDNRSGHPSRKWGERRSEVTISGAKTFRFSTRSSGSDEFSQSLDLTIDGRLGKSLSLTGVISDRGYNPSYGTANSRLSEFDKISLTLSSPVFRLDVGDMEYVDGRLGRNRRLSGAAFRARQKLWSTNAVVARPDGRFAAARFLGANNVQGPYPLADDGAAASIVPGSETVWLDGRRLESGVDRDYTIDYPAGSITFGVRIPIYSRSRIEIDYEPLLTAYRGELIGGGGGLSTADSSLTLVVDVLRDGDDPDEPLFGDLSAAERDSLQAAGDDVDQAFRSGIVADSVGDYDLITVVLPDSVFRYVGRGNGDFRLSFSFVGAGRGDYRFLGNGIYEYVGLRLADYLPVITLQAPERTDYLLVAMSGRRARAGFVEAEIRLSDRDRNLLSSLDDDDNDGQFLRLTAAAAVGRDDSLTYQFRRRDKEFAARQRLFPADLARVYLVPNNVGDTVDLELHELGTTLSPMAGLRIRAMLSQLEAADDFRSRVGEFSLRGTHNRLTVRLGGTVVRAKADTVDLSREGEAENVLGRLEYGLASQLKAHVEYEYDHRRLGWFEGRGAQFDRWQVGLTGVTESISFEHFDEDSSGTEQRIFLNRETLRLASERRWGPLSYAATLTRQWLEDEDGTQADLLSRLSYQYRAPRTGINIGGAYTLSAESRNARGLTYVEVDPGEGNYILIDSVFVPDPDGNYLQLEELLSDQADVRHGQKSFHVSRSTGGVLFRFDYNLDEELKQEGERSWLWLVPFLSDDTQPYLYYLRGYQAELRMLRLEGGHAINVVFQENLQMREVAEVARRRVNRDLTTSLKQQHGALRFEERLRLFWIDRDEYYSGAGEIDGHQATAMVRRVFSGGEAGLGVERRKASSAKDEQSEIWSAVLTGRLQVVQRGELRGSVELYRQTLSGVTGTPSYSLTDNHQGERGAIWSMSARYGIPSGLRLNLSVSGTHANDRAGRVTARGELVAGF